MPHTGIACTYIYIYNMWRQQAHSLVWEPGRSFHGLLKAYEERCNVKWYFKYPGLRKSGGGEKHCCNWELRKLHVVQRPEACATKQAQHPITISTLSSNTKVVQCKPSMWSYNWQQIINCVNTWINRLRISLCHLMGTVRSNYTYICG